MSPLLEVRVGSPWGAGDGREQDRVFWGNVLLPNLGAGYMSIFSYERLPGCAHDVCTLRCVYYASVGS